MARERKLLKVLARIWHEVKGTEGAYCPYPFWEKDSFEDLACTTPQDVIVDAFELWTKDARGPEIEKHPIDSFMKCAAEYLLKVRPRQHPTLEK